MLVPQAHGKVDEVPPHGRFNETLGADPSWPTAGFSKGSFSGALPVATTPSCKVGFVQPTWRFVDPYSWQGYDDGIHCPLGLWLGYRWDHCDINQARICVKLCRFFLVSEHSIGNYGITFQQKALGGTDIAKSVDRHVAWCGMGYHTVGIEILGSFLNRFCCCSLVLLTSWPTLWATGDSELHTWPFEHLDCLAMEWVAALTKRRASSSKVGRSEAPSTAGHAAFLVQSCPKLSKVVQSQYNRFDFVASRSGMNLDIQVGPGSGLAVVSSAGFGSETFAKNAYYEHVSIACSWISSRKREKRIEKSQRPWTSPTLSFVFAVTPLITNTLRQATGWNSCQWCLSWNLSLEVWVRKHKRDITWHQLKGILVQKIVQRMHPSQSFAETKRIFSASASSVVLISSLLFLKQFANSQKVQVKRKDTNGDDSQTASW